MFLGLWLILWGTLSTGDLLAAPYLWAVTGGVAFAATLYGFIGGWLHGDNP
jgi:hypothetical protein